MARLIGNPFQQDEAGSGFQFEREVREYLQRRLPDDYLFTQGVYIPGRAAPRAGMAPTQPREIDFVVVGPNGLFFLEAKKRDIVSGLFVGEWTSSWSNPRGVVQAPFAVNEVEKARKKISRAGTLIAKRLPGGARDIRFVFVFPDRTVLNLTDHRGQPELESYPMFATRLSTLKETITRQPLPAFGSTPRALTSDEVLAAMRVFVQAPTAEPDTALHYRVLDDYGPWRTAANGLRFRRVRLQNVLSDERRRGKSYDINGLLQANRPLYEEQIRRHLHVASNLPAHELIAPPGEIFPDYPNGQILVVESWLDGEDLETFVETRGRDRLDVPRVLRDIARALEILHDNRFVLRDLRPSCVLLTERQLRDGSRKRLAMLTDFDAAKDLDGQGSVFAGESVPDPYRAPELQSDAGAADARADLYSWGAIAYWLLTGATFEGHMDWRPTRPVPDRVAAVIQRCLEARHAGRPGSATAVLAALENWS